MTTYLRASALGRLVVPLILAAGLSACAQGPEVQVTPVTKTHFPAEAPAQVVMLNAAPPAQDYRQIATVQVQGAPGTTSVQLTAILIKKAAAIGGNAIWISGVKKDTLNDGPVQYNPAGGNYQVQTSLPSLTLAGKVYRKEAEQ